MVSKVRRQAKHLSRRRIRIDKEENTRKQR